MKSPSSGSRSYNARVDIAATPKILAAALLGATIATSLPHPQNRSDGVMLKLEWVESGGKKRSESVTLRAPLERPTTLRQPRRNIEVQPNLSGTGDGSYSVDLNVSTFEGGATATLNTQVRLHEGETVVVMGTIDKEGRSSSEKLLFLTASPL